MVYLGFDKTLNLLLQKVAIGPAFFGVNGQKLKKLSSHLITLTGHGIVGLHAIVRREKNSSTFVVGKIEKSSIDVGR